jgi:hypothetical protein
MKKKETKLAIFFTFFYLKNPLREQVWQWIEHFYQIHTDEFDRVDQVQYQPIVATRQKKNYFQE